jgi:hypothetical protein
VKRGKATQGKRMQSQQQGKRRQRHMQAKGKESEGRQMQHKASKGK